MSPSVVDKLRRAGRIAAQARDRGAGRIVPGASVRDVCQFVDEEIVRLGGRPAFPTQSSRNEIAAHYCPSPDDATRYGAGDLAKLDVGVHVDGYVVDTAVTVNVGDAEAGRPLVAAARQALDAAIAAARPGGRIRDISEAIEQEIAGFSLRPVRNLCGHGVARWRVHCAPPIPNVADLDGGQLLPDRVVAIEPFATSGSGAVVERGEPQVFRLAPETPVDGALDAEVVAAIRAFRGLPFARRQLSAVPRERVEAALEALLDGGRLSAYPPLVEPDGHPVAQAEHSVLVGTQGVEVLTR